MDGRVTEGTTLLHAGKGRVCEIPSQIGLRNNEERCGSGEAKRAKACGAWTALWALGVVFCLSEIMW